MVDTNGAEKAHNRVGLLPAAVGKRRAARAAHPDRRRTSSVHGVVGAGAFSRPSRSRASRLVRASSLQKKTGSGGGSRWRREKFEGGELSFYVLRLFISHPSGPVNHVFRFFYRSLRTEPGAGRHGATALLDDAGIAPCDNNAFNSAAALASLGARTSAAWYCSTASARAPRRASKPANLTRGSG